MIERVLWIGRKRKTKITKQQRQRVQDLEIKLALIQALIPIGLAAVAEELKGEIERLVRHKYSRLKGLPGHYLCGS